MGKKKRVSLESMMGGLAMDMRREAVASLLAGNDTQCFTTEQYRFAYHQVSVRVFGCPDRPPDLPIEMADMHLRSLAGEVWEVRPGVWTADPNIAEGCPHG